MYCQAQTHTVPNESLSICWLSLRGSRNSRCAPSGDNVELEGKPRDAMNAAVYSVTTSLRHSAWLCAKAADMVVVFTCSTPERGGNQTGTAGMMGEKRGFFERHKNKVSKMFEK